MGVPASCLSVSPPLLLIVYNKHTSNGLYKLHKAQIHAAASTVLLWRKCSGDFTHEASRTSILTKIEHFDYERGLKGIIHQTQLCKKKA